MSKQICFRDIDPLKRRQLIDRHRQLNRRITRATLGSFISSALAIFMPWNLLSVGINLVSLAKNVNQFLDLQKELALAGIKVGKRVIMEGFIQGVVVKLATTILLFGHDDLVLASGVMDHWIYEAGSLIANHTSLVFDGPTWSTQGLVQEDEIHRMSHAFIQEASGLAGLPAETMQQALGLQTAAELHAQGITEAWNAPAEQLVEQVALVGGVQAATEKISDVILEDPVDQTADAIRRQMKGQDNMKEKNEDIPPPLPPRPRPGL